MTGQSSNTLLANSVQRLRQARGWSQEELAARCGLHRTYVGAIERGERNITLDTLDRLAKAFGCSGADLLHAHRGDQRRT